MRKTEVNGTHETKFACHWRTCPLVAIYRAGDAADAAPAARALCAGGIRLFEITLTTAGALCAIRAIRDEMGERMAIGAGTVLTVDDARSVLEAEAEFIVTPVFDREVVVFCKGRNVPLFCGCYTPTEAYEAHRAGAPFIKLFPADGLGPGFIRSMLAPLPFLRVVPTGGVDETNLTAFLAVGSAGAALGSSLLSRDVLKRQDWDELTRKAGRLSAVVRQHAMAEA